MNARLCLAISSQCFVILVLLCRQIAEEAAIATAEVVAATVEVEVQVNACFVVTMKLILAMGYPVVIINWVQYLGPPGPFSFPDSRDLLEVLGGLSWQREGGGP